MPPARLQHSSPSARMSMLAGNGQGGKTSIILRRVAAFSAMQCPSAAVAVCCAVVLTCSACSFCSSLYCRYCSCNWLICSSCSHDVRRQRHQQSHNMQRLRQDAMSNKDSCHSCSPVSQCMKGVETLTRRCQDVGRVLNAAFHIGCSCHSTEQLRSPADNSVEASLPSSGLPHLHQVCL